MDYVGQVSWIAVDDFFTLTVTNPDGASLTRTMDWNDAWGRSSGPQAVIYGTAAAAPDVTRWGAPWTPGSYPKSPYVLVFDEPGAFDPIFTTAGTYNFRFLGGNTGATHVYHPDMYLLVDANVVPVPGAAVLGVIGLGLTGWRLKRRQVQQRRHH